MVLRKSASIYAIIVGLGMIGIWTMLLITGQDQQLHLELKTVPIAITMAITSDILTALLLLTAGFSLWLKYTWSVKIYILSMGFLFYSTINAAGFYGQRGDILFVIMFIAIFVLSSIFTLIAVTKWRKS